MKYWFIDDDYEAGKAVERLSKLNEIAIDFEGDSNLHRYGFHLCLIQIYDGEQYYIFDTLSLKSLESIKIKLLENKNISKLCYSPEFDVKLLKYTAGINLKNIIDLQYAAKLLGSVKLSLGNVINEFLGIKTSKSRSRQQSNWSLRPLKASQLEYALDDVRYLFELRDKLLPMIIENDFEQVFNLHNKDLEDVEFNFPKYPYLAIKRASLLTKKQKIYLKYFYRVRENLAKKMDIPVYKLLKNETLLKLAQKPPLNKDEWEHLFKKSQRISAGINSFLRAKIKADKEIENL